VVGGSSCDSARELVAASIVAEIDEGSKGLLNEPRFEIFGVDLWYKIRGRSQTITKTATICSQTLNREFAGLVCAAESGVCRSLQEFVRLRFSLEILYEASDS